MNTQNPQLLMLIRDRNLILSLRPRPLTARYVRAPLELPDAILDPLVNARRQRPSEVAEINEEA
jgi:hypothetical protein